MSNMIGPALPPPITDNTNIRKTDSSSPWAISDALTAQDIARNKRFKGAIQSTPWLDHWEFEDVGRSLATGARSCLLVGTTKNKKARARKRRRHSDDADYQQRPEAIPTSSTAPRAMMEEPLASLYRALDRMSVWKIRMDTRIPHAVESSYQLAQVHARSNNNNNNGNNHRSYGGTEELRLAYGCAILRSINGLADALQQTRAHAASIAVLCGDLGIPSWLVDVRHAATHNQLPTLSVLKLAATTLLEYLQQQYWEPRSFLTSYNNVGDANSSRGERNSVMTDLVQHLLAYKEQQEIALAKAYTEAERKAAERKGKTDNSSNKSKSKKKTPARKKALLSYDSSDSDEEVYLDGLVSSSWNPALSSSKTMGTSINRFAVLFEEDTKKKKKNKEQKTKPDVKATAEEKAEQKKTKEASPHHHARQFIKTAMQSNQFDVAYQAALLFLVWGGVGGMEQGALLPPPVASADELYPETAAGIQRMQQMYGILLVVLGHEWSGFLHALMIHLVDSIMTLEQTQSQPHEEEAAETIKEKSRRLFFLESWVRYLLSRDFVANFQNGLNKKKNSKTNINSKAKTINQEMAPWSFLEQMWYPLNSLCDRLELSCSSSSRATSQRLVDLFCDVLGEYRVSQFGVVFDDEDDGESVLSRENGAEDVVDSMEEDGLPPSSTSSRNEETLDDTAKPEVPENTAKDKSDSSPRKRRAWVKCTSWEPCTIGALPGHPCCS